MVRHSCRPRGSIHAHGDDPSRLQAVWKHTCSQGCPVTVASRVEAHLLTGMSLHGRKLREAYLLPFLCQGVCARGSQGGMDPFPDLSSTPERGSDPQGSGEAKSSPRGSEEARPTSEGSGEAERPPGGSDKPRPLLLGRTGP
jgi:hypothetical protein